MKRLILMALAGALAGTTLIALATPGEAQDPTGRVYLPIISSSRIIDPDATPTPSPTPTETATPTTTAPVSDVTATPDPAVTPSPTPTRDPDATGQPTAEPTDQGGSTPDPSVTPIGDGAPTATPTPRPTATPTRAPSSCQQYGQGLQRSSRFGVQMHHDTGEESKYFDTLVASRAGWLRLIAPWQDTEPNNTTPENYDWELMDSWLAAPTHLNINVIGTFGFAPRWAATNTNSELDKTDLSEMVEFVTAMVERYDGDGVDDAPCSPIIDYWEFYNEPDRAARQQTGYYRNSWGEIPEKYAEMLAAVYPAVKEANPRAKVLFGGIAYEWFNGPFVEEFTDGVLAAGGGDYFDIMNFHFYPEFWYAHAPYPPGLYEKTVKIRAILAEHGVDKPMFITETGSHSNSQASFKMSEELQARYVPQLLVQSIAADVETTVWFMLYDTPEDIWPYKNGLATDDDPPQRKLSFDAYQVAIDMYEDAEFVRAWEDDEKPRDDLYVYEMRNTVTGKTFWVAWISPVDSTAETEIEFEADYLTRRDIYGIGVIVTDAADGEKDGVVTLEVNAQPVYIEQP